MPSVSLSEEKWQQVLNILATTKEWSWTVTNPLLMEIGNQLRSQHDKTISKEPGARTDGKGTEEVHHG
jgi:hypothetical protein